MMEFRKLKYFSTVVREGSFTKAADKLLVAQPALSRSIQSLEEYLGTNLLDRKQKQRGISLTPEGELLYEYAQKIVNLAEVAEKEIRSYRSNSSTLVRIAVPHMFGKVHLLDLINQFKKLQPNIQVSIMEVGMSKIADLVETEEVELGIVSADQSSTDSKLEIFPLLEDQVMVCVSETHPFSKRESVDLQRLVKEPLIVFDEGYFLKKLYADSEQVQMDQINIALRVNQDAFITSMVSENLGVALIMKSAINETPHIGMIPLSPPMFVSLGIGKIKTRKLSTSAQILLNYICQKFAVNQV